MDITINCKVLINKLTKNILPYPFKVFCDKIKFFVVKQCRIFCLVKLSQSNLVGQFTCLGSSTASVREIELATRLLEHLDPQNCNLQTNQLYT